MISSYFFGEERIPWPKSILPRIFGKEKEKKKVNNLFGKISSGVNCCKSPPNDA